MAAMHDLVGLMHASMAVYDAFCDRTPMLLLGGSGPAEASDFFSPDLTGEIPVATYEVRLVE
jgi:thiamine pyrophosphate-dependent acetolactate synthase large subunit-like protein